MMGGTTGSPRATQSSLDNTYQDNEQQKRDLNPSQKKKQAGPRHRAAQPLLLLVAKMSYSKRGIPGNPVPYDILWETRSSRRSGLTGYRVRTARDERGSRGASRAARPNVRNAISGLLVDRQNNKKKMQQKYAPNSMSSLL